MKKASMNNLNEKAINVFNEILIMTKGKVVNAPLSLPIENSSGNEVSMGEYFKRLDNYNQYNIKLLVARHWFSIAFFICSMITESRNNKPNYFTPVLYLMTYLILGGGFYSVFAHVPFEAMGGNFLNEKEAKQVDLAIKQSQVMKQRKDANVGGFFEFFSGLNTHYSNSGLMPFEHQCFVSALFSVERKVFDCVSISGLVILNLLKYKIDENIERFYKTGTEIRDPHSYVVLNRILGNYNDIQTWNNDSIIIDPWYGICMTAAQIKETPNFFLRYPLLSPHDKCCSAIPPNFCNSEYCIDFIKKLNALINPSQSTYRTIPTIKKLFKFFEFYMIFPRIGTPKEKLIRKENQDASDNYFKNF